MLLHKTHIDQLVKTKILGKVARIGGSVDQLVSYHNCRVQDFDVQNGGYGDIRQLSGIRDIKSSWLTAVRQTWQELRHMRYGDRVRLDRNTKVLDILDAHQHPELQHQYDACITSNVIEHSPNPIFMLLNYYFLTKIDGWQFHAIPHYKYTFDVFRQPTLTDHFLTDFEQHTGPDDLTHNADYYNSAVIKHGYKRSYHLHYPVAYPYIHFHVFDEKNVRQLFSTLFEEVTVDVLRTTQFSDVVVLAKNRLKPSFVKKHAALIESYSANFLEHRKKIQEQ